MSSSDGVDLKWRKSSYSQNEECVEVAFSDSSVLVRDTKCRQHQPLSVRPAAWADFLCAVRSGEFPAR